MRVAFISLAAAALLAACSGPPAPAGPQLTATEFKENIIGKKLKYESADAKYPVTAVGGYNADGTISSEWTSGGKSGHYAGNWVLDGDKVCVTNSAANGGGSGCYTWRKVGEVSFAEINPDGNLHGMNTIIK